jgi:hypothetical protein
MRASLSNVTILNELPIRQSRHKVLSQESLSFLHKPETQTSRFSPNNLPILTKLKNHCLPAFPAQPEQPAGLVHR